MTQPAKSILVVDDEPDLLSEVVDYLHRRGRVVLTTGSFSEAVRVFDDKIN
jgi:DNA-binding response OmpR family regulator